MGTAEMKQIAAWIDRGVQAARVDDGAALDRIAGEVRELTQRFAAPGL
jgi:glycine hydroxymethyltransferase